MNDGTQTIDEIEKRMIRAWAFHPDDLMFNQLGELSQRQKRWLQLEIVGWCLQIAMNSALIICAWVVYYLEFQYHAKSLWWVGGLVWSIGLGYGIFMSIKNIQPIWADITENEVKSMAGVLTKNIANPRRATRKGYTVSWTIEIKSYQFSIHQFAYDSLIDHQRYCVFYTPALQKVINIQPLSDAGTEKKSTLATLQERAKQNEENPT